MLVYEAEVIEDHIMAESSRLYCLPPKGKGSAYIESLSSYISRLSEAHCLKTGTLFSKFLFPYMDKHYMNQIIVKGGNGFYKHAHTINGVTDTAISFAELITNLTGSFGIEDLTLLRFKEVMPNRGLLKTRKAWCPACFEDMKRNKIEIYEPLIWLLQPVNICLNHQIKLEEQCFNCSQPNLIVSRRSRPGYCEHCNGWLGHSITYTYETDDWEMVKTIRVAELLENTGLFRKKDICRSLGQLVARFSNSNITDFSRKVEIPKTTIWSWYSGKNVPTIEDVLRICNKFGISLIDFYSNKLTFEKFSVIHAKRKGKVNSNNTLNTLCEIGIKARIFVKSKETESVTVTAMAKMLSCNKKTLYKYFDKLCKVQTIRSRQYRRDLHEIRLAKRQKEVETALLNIINQGHTPSLQRVSRNLKKPGILRSPEVRVKFNILFTELKNSKYRGERKIII